MNGQEQRLVIRQFSSTGKEWTQSRYQPVSPMRVDMREDAIENETILAIRSAAGELPGSFVWYMPLRGRIEIAYE